MIRRLVGSEVWMRDRNSARARLVEFLIKEGVEVNAAEYDGASSFWFCASCGQEKLCKMLVDRGADPRVSTTNGATALHIAAQNGRIDVVRYLVEDCGLDVNALTTDVCPKTPLCLAAGKRQLEVCKFLLGK